MSPIRGRLGDVGMTNGDTFFSLVYLGPTLVIWPLDIRISLKLIQVLTDTKLSSIQVLHWLLNEHVKYVLAILAFMLVSLLPVYTDEGYIPFFPWFSRTWLNWAKRPSEIKYHTFFDTIFRISTIFSIFIWQDYYG